MTCRRKPTVGFIAASLAALSGTTVLLLLLRGPAPVQASPVGVTRCVAPSGWCGYDPCQSAFGRCLTTIQAAVDIANEGDEIRVEQGRYTGTHLQGGAMQVVYISKTVTIRGGYDNGFQQSFPLTQPTVVDAEGKGRVIYITGDISPTVEGLRITGGDATGLGGGPGSHDVGGGMYVHTATVTISGCVIYSNTASTLRSGDGGGVYLTGSDATLSGNTVQGNIASMVNTGFGGGLCLHDSGAELEGNTVQGNTASTAGEGYGGGLCLDDSENATLNGNIVQGNTASTAGIGNGGGLCLGDSENATLEDNTVQGNTASTAGMGNGGGLCLWGSDARLNGNMVQDNTASTAGDGYGGGLFLHGSHATLSGNTVVSNTASTVGMGNGGGLCLRDSGATLEGNVVQGNTASEAAFGLGGGLLLWGGDAALSGNTVVCNTATLGQTAIGLGGGLCVYQSDPLTLTNNIVANNQANTTGLGRGSGLWFDGAPGDPTSGRLLHTTIAHNATSGGGGQGVYVGDHTTLAFTNTIIAGHASVGITVTAGSTVTLDHTLWHGNGTNTGGAGAITNADPIPGQDPLLNADHHLVPGSPAIDAGVHAGVSTDIDGDSRPLDGDMDGTAIADVGADEFKPRPIYLPLVVQD